MKVWSNKQCFYVRKWTIPLFYAEQCQKYPGLSVNHTSESYEHLRGIRTASLLGKCVSKRVEGSTSEPPNKAEHPWTREHPACNLERPLATNFITQRTVWKIVKLSCHGTHGFFAVGTCHCKGKSAFPNDRISTARGYGFQSPREVILRRKDSSSRNSSNIRNDLSGALFLRVHICSTGLPPAGMRRIFRGFILFLPFFFPKEVSLHQCTMKNNGKWFIFTCLNLNVYTWPVLDICQS